MTGGYGFPYGADHSQLHTSVPLVMLPTQSQPHCVVFSQVRISHLSSPASQKASHSSAFEHANLHVELGPVQLDLQALVPSQRVSHAPSRDVQRVSQESPPAHSETQMPSMAPHSVRQ